MKYLKFIMLCALMSVSVAQANEAPQIIGFHIGMTREQTAALCAEYNEQGIRFNAYQFTPLNSVQQMQLDNMMIGMDPFGENFDMNYEYMKLHDVSKNASLAMGIGERPVLISTHPRLCNSMKHQKLRQVKPDDWWVIQDQRYLGVIMLGFSGNEIVEISVSPLLFNWLSYSPRSIADMVGHEWNIKFNIDNSMPYNQEYCMINNQYIVAVTGNQTLYIGKMVSEQEVRPSMNLNHASTQYYTCMGCQQEQMRHPTGKQDFRPNQGLNNNGNKGGKPAFTFGGIKNKK